MKRIRIEQRLSMAVSNLIAIAIIMTTAATLARIRQAPISNFPPARPRRRGLSPAHSPN